jgi:hypothetical protein
VAHTGNSAHLRRIYGDAFEIRHFDPNRYCRRRTKASQMAAKRYDWSPAGLNGSEPTYVPDPVAGEAHETNVPR